MGKKKLAQKATAEKPPTPTARREPLVQPPLPPVQTQSPPTSTPVGGLISTEAVIAFLRVSNPTADAQTLLAALNQFAGATAATSSQTIPTATPSPPIPQAEGTAEMPEPVPTTTLESPSKSPPQKETPISAYPSPQIDPTKVLAPSPISAYRLPADREEGEEGYKGESTDEEDYTTEENVEVSEERTTEGDRMEKAEERDSPKEKFEEEATMEMGAETTTTAEPDLDEVAKKQGLMTDEEFEQAMQGAPQEEDTTAEVAEGLDLASRAVRGESPEKKVQQPEGAPSESVHKEGRAEDEEKEAQKEPSAEKDEG